MLRIIFKSVNSICEVVEYKEIENGIKKSKQVLILLMNVRALISQSFGGLMSGILVDDIVRK